MSSWTTKHYELNFDKNFLSLTRWSFIPMGFWWGNPREGDHWVERGVDGRIILKWMYKNWDG